jgi:hypothetical protein
MKYTPQVLGGLILGASQPGPETNLQMKMGGASSSPPQMCFVFGTAQFPVRHLQAVPDPQGTPSADRTRPAPRATLDTDNRAPHASDPVTIRTAMSSPPRPLTPLEIATSADAISDTSRRENRLADVGLVCVFVSLSSCQPFLVVVGVSISRVALASKVFGRMAELAFAPSHGV